MPQNIRQELLSFREFKKNYPFVPKEIQHINDTAYCDGFPLEDQEHNLLPCSDTWINVGYKFKSPLSRLLSNLFPYEFDFRGQRLQSLESFFQGIKFPDARAQKYVFAYHGLNAYFIKSASDYDWRKTGYIYWQGQKIDRYSKEYDDLVDEVYISALQNPLYCRVLKKADRYLLHSIGKEDKAQTVLTRHEFERELNCLSAFSKQRES